MDIIFRVNTAKYEDIYNHLNEVSKLFFSELTNRVNIIDYAKKINIYAQKIEAWHNNKLIGLLAYYIANDGREYFVTNISVYEHFQNKGIGASLMSQLKTLAKEKSVDRIRLECARELKILNFYKRNGFVENHTNEETSEQICYSKPLVAIQCFVYNHETYLRDCFEGFVMQQTNFPFVVIVHDDASTDESAAIIREYEEKYPHIFKPIYETENQFSKRDGSLECIMNEALDATGAKYVAMCEGDDYWTNPLKLRKQVDFMEANIEYGLCYTDYNRLEDVNQILIESMFEKQNQYRPTSYEQQLLNPGYLAPMTWLYRHELIDIISKANVFTDGTYAYMLEFMYNSKVAYIPEVTAVYRSHVGSASSPIGNKALFRYTVGVFRTQIHYTQKYPCSEEIKRKVLMRGYLSKLPIAIMAEQEEFVREAKTFMDAQDMDIDLIIRELKQGEMKRKSYAYRLGKKLLTPFSWIRNKRK